MKHATPVMKHSAPTALVSLALIALLQSACPQPTGVGGHGGRSGTGGRGGTGGGPAGTGGFAGTGGGFAGTGGGKAPDAAVKRDTGGRAPDAPVRRDAGRRSPDAAVKRDAPSNTDAGAIANAKSAVATIQPVLGGTITGKVTFIEVTNGIRVTYELENCPPGNHLTFITAGQGCESAQAQGQHWDKMRGEGIGTIACGADGRGILVYVRDNAQAALRWSIAGVAQTDILGRPLVINAVDSANQSHGCGIILISLRPVTPPSPY
jgi:hypothetical protein